MRYNFSSGVSVHWDSFDLTLVGADQGCPYKVPKLAILDSMNSRNLILVHTSIVCECQADYMYSITFHLTQLVQVIYHISKASFQCSCLAHVKSPAT